MFRTKNLTSLNPNIPMPNSLEQRIPYLETPSTKHFLQRKPPIHFICCMNQIKSNNETGGKLEKTSLKEACLVETIDFNMKVD
jgi:hypothetical protein